MVTLRVLIVEDDPADVELITRELMKSGFDPICLVSDSARRIFEPSRRGTTGHHHL